LVLYKLTAVLLDSASLFLCIAKLFHFIILTIVYYISPKSLIFIVFGEI